MKLVHPRSDLKNPNYFNFSSFFGDFCLKVSRVMELRVRVKQITKMNMF